MLSRSVLRRCGLFSERVAARFHEFLRRVPDLPEDTAARVMGELV